MKKLILLFAPLAAKAGIKVLEEIESDIRLEHHGCASIFEEVKRLIEYAILEQPKRFAELVKSQGTTPRIKVISMIEHVAGDYLKSSSLEFFLPTSRGKLNSKGERLLRLYDLNLELMVKCNGITKEEAQKKMGDIRKRIQESG